MLQVNSRRLCPILVLEAMLDVLATNIASATIDFAKDNVEDGVVKNPPSHGTGRSPNCSPSPLRGCDWTPIKKHSYSLIERNVCTHQRQLYSSLLVCNTEEAKETNSVHLYNEVCI